MRAVNRFTGKVRISLKSMCRDLKFSSVSNRKWKKNVIQFWSQWRVLCEKIIFFEVSRASSPGSQRTSCASVIVALATTYTINCIWPHEKWISFDSFLIRPQLNDKTCGSSRAFWWKIAWENNEGSLSFSNVEARNWRRSVALLEQASNSNFALVCSRWTKFSRNVASSSEAENNLHCRDGSSQVSRLLSLKQ